MITLELNLNEKQLPKLKREFSQLETVDDKLKFWQLRLKKNYLFYDKYALQEISPFLIRPNDSSEIYQLNHWLLENAILIYRDDNEKMYRSYDKMVVDFERRLEKALNASVKFNRSIDQGGTFSAPITLETMKPNLHPAIKLEYQNHYFRKEENS